jgi:Family of unknown function (DUF7002)
MKQFRPSYFYHWAEPANLASIRRHGLLSTERLVALTNLPPVKKEQILSQHRPDQLVLPNGISIRDQAPMPPGSLAKALPMGISPSDWYRFLNRFVFLWADRERAERHRRAFSGRSQALLVFDAGLLLAERKDQVLLSPINSGNARRRPAPRSLRLFVPYQEWMAKGWPVIAGKRRSQSVPPAEIVLEGQLPLERYLVEIISVESASLARPW